MTISTWKPINRTISSITQANPGVVTTTADHNYKSGLFIRPYFPANFGMPEVNGNLYQITVLTDSTFSIDANTTNYQAFNSSLSTTQTPQCIPVAEIATTLQNVERNTLTPPGGATP